MSNSESEMDETVVLFRPTGPHELALIQESGYSAFPLGSSGNRSSIRCSMSNTRPKSHVTGTHEMATQAMSHAFEFAATFCTAMRSIR
jgi:hypothetical protein